MSVKTMTVEQLRGDLDAVARMWPAGTPPEQADRVNALKGELKRRGEDFAMRAPREEDKPRSLLDMTDDQLSKELRKLSDRIGADPKDENAQERFANVRYEIRKRQRKADADPQSTRGREEAPPTRAPLPPRAMEIPDEVVTPAVETRPVGGPLSSDDPGPSVMIPRGYTATAVASGLVIKHIVQTGDSLVQIASAWSVDEAEAFIATVQEAVTKAKAFVK